MPENQEEIPHSSFSNRHSLKLTESKFINQLNNKTITFLIALIGVISLKTLDAINYSLHKPELLPADNNLPQVKPATSNNYMRLQKVRKAS